jgi:hypothetical protein
MELLRSKASTLYIKIGIQFDLSRETMTVSLALEILLKIELKQRKKFDRDVLKSKDRLLPEINTIPRYFMLFDHGIEMPLIETVEQKTFDLLPKRIQTDLFKLTDKSRSSSSPKQMSIIS